MTRQPVSTPVRFLVLTVFLHLPVLYLHLYHTLSTTTQVDLPTRSNSKAAALQPSLHRRIRTIGLLGAPHPRNLVILLLPDSHTPAHRRISNDFPIHLRWRPWHTTNLHNNPTFTLGLRLFLPMLLQKFHLHPDKQMVHLHSLLLFQVSNL